MKRQLLTILLFLTTILTFAQTEMFVNTEQLNIRSGAGSKYEVIGKLSKSEKITVISTDGKWTEIKLDNGTKGFVSTKFLSNTSQTSKKEKSSNWPIILIIGGIILFSLFKKSNKGESSNSRSAPTKKQEVRRTSSNSAVYRFRIKGSGNAGGFIYADGMNVEIAVTGLGSGGSPFNNIVEKKFVQEIARKYNVEPRCHSGIKMLFKRDRLDVEIM